MEFRPAVGLQKPIHSWSLRIRSDATSGTTGMIVAEHRQLVPFGHRHVRKLRRVEFDNWDMTLIYERNQETWQNG
jgi:hypothetical protein